MFYVTVVVVAFKGAGDVAKMISQMLAARRGGK
jgi:delta 1-pyrroline-5-carboxylate dehydrogenase